VSPSGSAALASNVAFDPVGEFPSLRDRVFLNHSAVAPLPARTAGAMARWLEQAQASVAEDWAGWAAALRRARTQTARLLGAKTEEIAFVHNTTHGLLCVANSLRWRPGDNVVTAAHEFPANVHPWRNLAARGVALRAAPEREGRFDVADLAGLIDRRTRLVAVSLVQYSTGFRMPVEALAEICRPRGILLCLDGIQGIGALAVDVDGLGCDFLAADGHKWLLGPEGFGALYVRASALDQLNEAMTGWQGRLHPGHYDDLAQPLKPTAERLEEGTRALGLAIGFEQSTGLLLEVGLRRVWEAIEGLTDQLVAGLRSLGFTVISPRGPAEKSGIVAFVEDGMDATQWQRALAERKIFVAARRGWLRASPHFYNQPRQIEALLQALRELKLGRGVAGLA